MATGNILIVDDEDKMRHLLRRIISCEGYIAHEAADLKTAEMILRTEEVDVVVGEMRLPDGSGLDLTRKIRSRYPAIEVLLLTAHARIADGVEAMRSGAFDYLSKGIDNDRLLPLIARAMEKAVLQRKIGQLRRQVAHAFGWGQIIGQSLALQQALGIARKVADSDTTVLLSGETGTGKELFARAIHGGSPRAVQPFFALNCSSLSKDLLESELFGHVAGAFTGALRDKRGLIEEAQGGTLFLDEIGEMPLGLQAKLLRVLEARQFFKVGSVQPTAADVRVISATNRHLPTEVDEGRFREDLYYRLNVVTLDIPPLRERKKDIAVLASHFVQQFAVKMGKRRPALSREFIQLLERQVWKGNIRELRNVIERALILSDGLELGVESLPVEFRSDAKEVVMLSAFDLASVEKLHIQRVLNYTKGNKVEAAKLLNIGLTTVYRKVEEYGMDK